MNGREWQARAGCREVDPEWFFPVAETGRELVRQEARAKRVCRGCPVLAECREFAVAELAHGVAGGLGESERRAIRARRPVASAPPAPVAVEVSAVASKREKTAAGRAAVRAGRPADVLTREFGVSTRTVARWAAQVRDEAKRGAA